MANSTTSTPIHRAVAAKDVDAVRQLLENADPMARDEKNNTPLHLAALVEAPAAIVDALVRKGADPHAKNANEWTPMSRIEHYGPTRNMLAILGQGVHEIPDPPPNPRTPRNTGRGATK